MDILHSMLERVIDEHLQEQGLTREEADELIDRLSDSLPGLIAKTADSMLVMLRERQPDMLREWRGLERGFVRRHFRHWMKGLDLLEEYIVISYEAGEAFSKSFRSEAAANRDYVFYVLNRLHARGILVSKEVLTLLKHGFADGAHTRWRTLHEIAVTALFIAKNGQDVAERYLLHDAIESYKAMLSHQEHGKALGFAPVLQSEADELKAEYDALCNRFGKSFAGRYGWAAETLNNKQPNFSHIEEAVELEHLRPYYKLASHNVHAGPKGISFRMGLTAGANILLSGPSNYGLTDPAYSTALSLLHITFALLGLSPNIDRLVMREIMRKMVPEIGETFLQIQTAMEAAADEPEGSD